MAKDIKLYKDGNEITINESQLDSFISLGWKQDKQNISTSKNNLENRYILYFDRFSYNVLSL